MEANEDLDRGLQLSDIDIDNPLRGIDLKNSVRHFAKENDLEDLTDILLRGAQVAEDPDNYSKVEGLTPKEKEALKREYEEKNPFRILGKLPKQLRTIIITCSMAAMTQFVSLFPLYGDFADLFSAEDGTKHASTGRTNTGRKILDSIWTIGNATFGFSVS